MVKFLSPAGVTPVSHPVPPANSGRQPQVRIRVSAPSHFNRRIWILCVQIHQKCIKI